MDVVPDVVPTAVRVWAVPDPGRDDANSEGVAQVPRRRPLRRYPAEALVFDTETRDEASQRLLVGVWRYYRDDAAAGTVGRTCIAEGFFYPDDLPQHDPNGWRVLQQYVAHHRAEVAAGFDPALQLIPESQWLDDWLYTRAVRHRARCDIVGFNLPFDFGALAKRWGAARGRHRGGWSLALWGRHDEHGAWQDQPLRRRLLLRSIDPRRTLVAWGPTWSTKDTVDPDVEDPQGGRFVDLRTLAYALTDRSHTLESACAAFGDSYEKTEVDYGAIDPTMLGYALDDVRHTGQLYRNCVAELRRHEGIDLRPSGLYSPAGVGAQYLRAMGLLQPLKKYQDLDPQFLGWTMSAFHGGRAEARIVRTPVPVVVADFTSMYPAINGLLDTWPLLRAADVTIQDVTDHVRALATDPNLGHRLFDPAAWRDAIGVTLVEIDHPAGVVLPVRAGYDPHSRDFGIGVNPLHYDGTLWYTLPDILAAALHGPTPVHIRRALRLRPQGIQAGLRAVLLRGQVGVDPRGDRNPFVVMIEERQRVKHDASLPAQERDRLDRFLKITANATAYGSLARFDRTDVADPVGVTVYGPGDQPFHDRTEHPEKPGPYCFPPLAASITAGARLMLTLIETAVRDAGGSYAFMDTDSIAIVATATGGEIPCATASGHTVQALTHQQVRGVLRRFEPLNPYSLKVVNDDPSLGRSPWKVEHDSLNRDVWCYAIAAKRYALYTPTKTGPQLLHAVDAHEESHDARDTPAGEDAGELTDWSEHGLGMYLDPSAAAGTPAARDSKGGRLWIRDAWQAILTAELNHTHLQLPAWADRFAVTQFSVSTPAHARWFHLDSDTHTAGKPRPFGFGLLAHVDPAAQQLRHHSGVPVTHPAAQYDKRPQSWTSLTWYDRHTARPIHVASADTLGDDPDTLARAFTTGDPLTLRTIGNVLRHHPRRPELKSLTPGGQTTGGTTSGQLRRRPIASHRVLTDYIGKEGNRLLERATGEVTEEVDYRTTYGKRDGERWEQLTRPALQLMWKSQGDTIAEALGVSTRTLRAWRNGDAFPHAGGTRHLQRLERLIGAWATQQLRHRGRRVPSDPRSVLYAYLAWVGEESPVRQ